MEEMTMSVTINSVKYVGGNISVNVTEMAEFGASTVDKKCSWKPLPELLAAMNAFRAAAREACHFENGYGADAEINAVHLKRKENLLEKVIVHGIIRFEDGTFNFNSPGFSPLELDGEIATFEKEALAYLGGAGVQGELPLGGSETPEPQVEGEE
jgi:hypothetical protein